MDAKTLKELGGTIREITVPFGGKMWNDERTVGGDWGLTVMVAEGADAQAVGVGAYEYLRQINKAAVGPDIDEMKAGKHRAVAQDVQQPAVVQRDAPEADKEGDELTFKCLKFTLAKQPDKKFRLELYPDIKGEPGKYPTIKFTAEREKMWEMLHDVADGYDFSDLPVEFACEWFVHYAIGREFEIKAGEHKGEKSHYKDLIAIKGM